MPERKAIISRRNLLKAATLATIAGTVGERFTNDAGNAGVELAPRQPINFPSPFYDRVAAVIALVTAVAIGTGSETAEPHISRSLARGFRNRAS